MMNTDANGKILQTLVGADEIDWQAAGQLELIEQALSNLASEVNGALKALKAARSETDVLDKAALETALNPLFMVSNPGYGGTITSKAIQAEAGIAVLRERLALSTRIVELTKEASA